MINSHEQMQVSVCLPVTESKHENNKSSINSDAICIDSSVSSSSVLVGSDDNNNNSNCFNGNDNGNGNKLKQPNPQNSKFSLDKRLFHALHSQGINTPTLKEFQESWAFANSIRSYFFKKAKSKSKQLQLQSQSLSPSSSTAPLATDKDTAKDTAKAPTDSNLNVNLNEKDEIKVIIDVAGGHGALAAIFLMLLPSVQRAVVIDPAIVEAGKRGIRDAWFEGHEHPNSNPQKRLEYQHESLFTALPTELETNIFDRNISNTNILVVACHACQHLTDATLRIAEQYGVHVAVLPCCQKDHIGSWKAAAKNLGIVAPQSQCNTSNNSNNKLKKESLAERDKITGDNYGSSGGGVGIVMDLLSAGKMMGENSGIQAGVRYEVKMKVIDPNITPQNRLIMCKAIAREGNGNPNGNGNAIGKNNDIASKKIQDADLRLQRAYKRAHDVSKLKKAVAPAPSPSPASSNSSNGLNGSNIEIEEEIQDVIPSSSLRSKTADLLSWTHMQSAMIGFTFGVLFSMSIVMSKRNHRI